MIFFLWLNQRLILTSARYINSTSIQLKLYLVSNLKQLIFREQTQLCISFGNETSVCLLKRFGFDSSSCTIFKRDMFKTCNV